MSELMVRIVRRRTILVQPLTEATTGAGVGGDDTAPLLGSGPVESSEECWE